MSFTAQEQELLAAVTASPDDPGPRLALADLLERSGDEYSLFIRWGFEHGEKQPKHGPEENVLIRARKWRRPLEEACGYGSEHWQGGMPSDRGVITRVQWLWKRGFVEEFTCRLFWWLRHGTAVVRAAPVRVLRLEQVEPRHVGYAPTGEPGLHDDLFAWQGALQGDSWDRAAPYQIPMAILRAVEGHGYFPTRKRHRAVEILERELLLAARQGRCVPDARW